MGAHGKPYAAMVSYSFAYGKLVENNTHGMIAGNHCGY